VCLAHTHTQSPCSFRLPFFEQFKHSPRAAPTTKEGRGNEEEEERASVVKTLFFSRVALHRGEKKRKHLCSAFGVVVVVVVEAHAISNQKQPEDGRTGGGYDCGVKKKKNYGRQRWQRIPNTHHHHRTANCIDIKCKGKVERGSERTNAHARHQRRRRGKNQPMTLCAHTHTKLALDRHRLKLILNDFSPPPLPILLLHFILFIPLIFLFAFEEWQRRRRRRRRRRFLSIRSSFYIFISSLFFLFGLDVVSVSLHFVKEGK